MGIGQIKEKIEFYSRHNFIFYRMMRRIEAAEKMDADELVKLTKAEAMKHIRYAASHSRFYRNLYRSIDLNGPFDEVYPALPVINKTQVRENEKDILTMSPHFLVKAYTSGTSGSPLTVYRSPLAILKENAYLLYFKIKHGMQLTDRMVSLRGKLDNTQLSYFNKAENTLYMSSFLLSASNIKRYADLLAEFRPRVIHAFPSSVFTLVNLLEEAGYKLEVPLIYTSSETLYPYQRDRIAKFFNAQIFDWYGNTERTTTLAQCEYGNYHEMPLYGVNEFQQHGVVSTSLINKSFPLIKYMMSDGFTVSEKGCACGKSPVISSIEGRVDDSVLLPDGSIVTRLGYVFQNVPHIKYAQIVQDTRTHINVNLVAAPEYNEETEQLILEKLRQRLNESVRITFHQVEEKDIIKTPSGKFKLVVSKLPRR